MARVAFRNFTGGEVTPSLSARYDLKKFGTFLSCCENFIPNLHGDIERRPGTQYIADLGAESVLLPFQFNTEPENNYLLIFQSGQILVATADGLVSGVSMDSPYALEDVYELSYAQVGDIVYLAHKDYALRKIYRSGTYPDYEWTLEEVALNQSIDAPGAPTCTWHRGTGNTSETQTDNETYELSYVVSAVDEDGIESVASEAGSVTGRYPTDWVSGDYVTLKWNVVEGAVEYNVYRDSAGYYGLIGTVSEDDVSELTETTGVRANGTALNKVHYSGTLTKSYTNYNGYQDREDTSSTSNLVVSADSSANAYVLSNGSMLVWVTQTTHTTTYTHYATDSDDYWDTTTSTGTSSYWALVSSTGEGSYTSYETGDLGTDSGAPIGTIGNYTLTAIYSTSSIITFQDQNYEADTATTPKEDWNPFEDGNHPATVCFHQQRMVLGGTVDSPSTFYMSRTGDFESFRKSRPTQDDDPVEYMLASGSIDEIKWMASFGDLFIGTAGAEYTATSSSAAITPSDVSISTQSYWGSAGLHPLIIGSSIIHCQRNGSHARDLAYSWENDNYTSNDLSLMAPQLVEGHNLIQWAFQQTPGNNIWGVRSDGVLLCLTYLRDQQVYGWSRHVTDGEFQSVATLCGEDEDITMFVVRRTVNGETHYFLERMATRFQDTDTIEDAFYVDCGLTFTFDEEVTEVSGLDHLEGKPVVVLGDGSPEEDHVVTDGTITLRYPAKTVTVGINYSSVLMPLPLESDGETGSSLARRRAYGKCVVRLYRSVGGKYAATQSGDLFDITAWKGRTFYELPFLPEVYGDPVPPFSGDIELSLPSGQDTDTSIILLQDRPMPLRLVALMMDVDFGEQG